MRDLDAKVAEAMGWTLSGRWWTHPDTKHPLEAEHGSPFSRWDDCRLLSEMLRWCGSRGVTRLESTSPSEWAAEIMDGGGYGEAASPGEAIARAIVAWKDDALRKGR